jgi:two-component system, LuxR family, response regulator FixJ
VSSGTVHVVDDDASIRDSLRVLLEASGFSVATYGTATEFLAAAPFTAGGCVLTDIRMPDVGGLELQERLSSSEASLPVIVMTGQGDVPLAVRAMKAGAIDFLEKPFEGEQLIDAVERALQQSRTAEESDRLAAKATRKLSELTPREREVLGMLVAGLSTKAIANRLGASPRTIEVHRARVFGKLDADTLPELVRISQAAGVTPIEETPVVE